MKMVGEKMPINHIVLVLCWLAVSAARKQRHSVVTIYHEKLGSEEKKIPEEKDIIIIQ